MRTKESLYLIVLSAVGACPDRRKTEQRSYQFTTSAASTPKDHLKSSQQSFWQSLSVHSWPHIAAIRPTDQGKGSSETWSTLRYTPYLPENSRQVSSFENYWTKRLSIYCKRRKDKVNLYYANIEEYRRPTDSSMQNTETRKRFFLSERPFTLYCNSYFNQHIERDRNHKYGYKIGYKDKMIWSKQLKGYKQ